MNIKPAPSALVRPNRSKSNVEHLLEIVTRSFWRWMELPVVRDSANCYWIPVIKLKRKENIPKSVIWLYIGFYIKYLDYKCIIHEISSDNSKKHKLQNYAFSFILPRPNTILETNLYTLSTRSIWNLFMKLSI